MTTAIFEKNYDRLLKLIPAIEEMEVGDSMKIENEPFMALNIDIIEKNDKFMVFAMAHNFIQNGDVMADPDMMIKLFSKRDSQIGTGLLSPLTYQLDSLGIFQEVFKTIDGKKMVNMKLQKQLNSFLSMWLRNLKSQGFNKQPQVIRK
jgi:uncharacterized protein YqiB (DUF1249 family)